ncbi:hypothetical protein NDU88_012089 [Pleurodeles waltl]|uniref:Uncharacterized protein n=1 Tax=Pleurodeles waltl TaxID=8319 RepID=A0AAV7R577_PLEWA|nr:hypothetical protein NDU88_012089 [Pleurodeles waltl]
MHFKTLLRGAVHQVSPYFPVRPLNKRLGASRRSQFLASAYMYKASSCSALKQCSNGGGGWLYYLKMRNVNDVSQQVRRCLGRFGPPRAESGPRARNTYLPSEEKQDFYKANHNIYPPQ